MQVGSFRDIPVSPLSLDAALAAMDTLHPDAHARYSWTKLRSLMSEVFVGHYFPVIEDTPVAPMIRGRVITVRAPTEPIDDRGQLKLIDRVSELGPVPVDQCRTFGRCHVPGSPVFYASFNEDTVLSELRPPLGSVVCFLTCVPEPGVAFKTLLIGEVDYIRRYGRSSVISEANPIVAEIRDWIRGASTESDYVRLVTDAFAADLFQRRADTEEAYKATSALCALLLELEGIDNQGIGEGLYYPSVAHRGGMNIALTRECFESKVRPIACKAVLVQRYYGHGIYKTHTLVEASHIDDDGNIAWAAPGCSS